VSAVVALDAANLERAIARHIAIAFALAKLEGTLRGLADCARVEADQREDANRPDEFVTYMEAELRDCVLELERLREGA